MQGRYQRQSLMSTHNRDLIPHFHSPLQRGRCRELSRTEGVRRKLSDESQRRGGDEKEEEKLENECCIWESLVI